MLFYLCSDAGDAIVCSLNSGYPVTQYSNRSDDHYNSRCKIIQFIGTFWTRECILVLSKKLFYVS